LEAYVMVPATVWRAASHTVAGMPHASSAGTVKCSVEPATAVAAAASTAVVAPASVAPGEKTPTADAASCASHAAPRPPAAVVGSHRAVV